jgi:hypothetical protein
MVVARAVENSLCEYRNRHVILHNNLEECLTLSSLVYSLAPLSLSPFAVQYKFERTLFIPSFMPSIPPWRYISIVDLHQTSLLLKRGVTLSDSNFVPRQDTKLPTYAIISKKQFVIRRTVFRIPPLVRSVSSRIPSSHLSIAPTCGTVWEQKPSRSRCSSLARRRCSTSMREIPSVLSRATLLYPSLSVLSGPAIPFRPPPLPPPTSTDDQPSRDTTNSIMRRPAGSGRRHEQ